MKVTTKHFIEGLAALAAIAAVVPFITGHATLSDFLPHSQPVDVWYSAALLNDSDESVAFAEFHSANAHWGLMSIKPHTLFTFTEKNHPIHVMIQGTMIIYTKPEEHVGHTYNGKECYVLDGATFTHEPTEAEKRKLPPNHFNWIIGGGTIDGSNGKGLKRFIPEDADYQLSTFEDPDIQILVPPDFVPKK